MWPGGDAGKSIRCGKLAWKDTYFFKTAAATNITLPSTIEDASSEKLSVAKGRTRTQQINPDTDGSVGSGVYLARCYIGLRGFIDRHFI